MTESQYRRPSAAYSDLMDFLEGPQARQRAQSLVSVITTTVEGMCSTENLCRIVYSFSLLLSHIMCFSLRT